MKGSYTTLVEFIPTIIAVLILLTCYLRYKTIHQLRSLGIQYLQAMRQLITHMQKHRGACVSVHKDDTFYRSKIISMQYQISRDFDHITQLGPWVEKHPEWSAITQHWARLVSNIYDLPAESSFEQHNRLIKNVLVFIDDMNIEYQLDTIGNRRIEIWQELLTLSEFIGQARGIGSAVAEGNEHNGAIVLDGANKKLELLSEEILQALESPHCKKVLDGDSLQCILDFLIYINKNVLMENPVISSKEFFDRSTKTLEVLFEKMDELLMKVHRIY